MARRRSVTKKQYMREMRVENMLIDGWRHNEILEMCSQEYGITPRYVERLIERVKKKWKEATVDDPASMKLKYIDRLERLYRLAVDAGQYGTAVKIQDTINKMVGLYQHESAESEGPDVITISGRSQPVAALPSGPSHVVDAEVVEPNGNSGTEG